MHKIIATHINYNLLPPTKKGDHHLLRPAFHSELRAARFMDLETQVTDPALATVFSAVLGFHVEPLFPGMSIPLPQPGDMILIGEIETKVNWKMLEVSGTQTYRHVIDLLEHADLEKSMFINLAHRGARKSWVLTNRDSFLEHLYAYHNPSDMYPCLAEDCPEGIYVHCDIGPKSGASEAQAEPEPKLDVLLDRLNELIASMDPLAALPVKSVEGETKQVQVPDSAMFEEKPSKKPATLATK